MHLKQLLTFLFLISTSLSLIANENYPGGQHTHEKPLNRLSFTWPSPSLTIERKLDFHVGKAIFDKVWVFAPASTTASDGLGPLYNARSCVRCHKGNGRGVLEGDSSSSPALFLRLSIAPTTSKHRALLASGKVGFIAEPTYGEQLQTFAYPGGKAEGQLEVNYTPIEITLTGKQQLSSRLIVSNKQIFEKIELLKPQYKIKQLGYGPIDQNLLFSPRIAPPLIGLGLLEAIDANDIRAFADPEDLNSDGISGKANIVWDEIRKKSNLGRFGWKAGTPSLEQQNNAALSGDIGISSWLFPQHWGGCTQNQGDCLQQKHGNKRRDKPSLDNLEAPKVITDLLLFYTQNIALAPTRNSDNPERIKGKKLFTQAGCHACHRPSYTTGNSAVQESLNNQTIWPYSDLLLHDMGKGLADGRPEFLANGQEWRTPPLWGIGLTKMVSGKPFYLHDGRARSLREAILWHGGEAEVSKQKVMSMTNKQRQQLIIFLESL
ncbi:MAG: CxxC motif-containing protein (DUF1111 family) [Pseudohongiellaceae bacterium]|jgi:CxxC motif-containing protein (DUF1111 family)